MDRRQRKTKEAIFRAFIEMLSEKNVNHITVGEIIERADVGRATFYAHFETKDFLIKALCEELFCHVFDAIENRENEHRHIFSCEAPDSVFLHLFQHFSKNDNHLLELLSSPNNDLFLRYFKTGLMKLAESQLENILTDNVKELPKDFLINHVAGTFVETLRWWIEQDMAQSPETVAAYFTKILRF